MPLGRPRRAQRLAPPRRRLRIGAMAVMRHHDAVEVGGRADGHEFVAHIAHDAFHRTRERIAETAAAGRMDAQSTRAFLLQRERRWTVDRAVGANELDLRNRYRRRRPPRRYRSAGQAFAAERILGLASRPRLRTRPRCRRATGPRRRRRAAAPGAGRDRIQLLVGLRVRHHEATQRDHRAHLVEAVATGHRARTRVAAPVVHDPGVAGFVAARRDREGVLAPARRRARGIRLAQRLPDHVHDLLRGEDRAHRHRCRRLRH